ncbi:unnamed protein product [Anisakis simplex]|uniref:Acetyl-CoA hydrolase n=1 Tax=Anisakis simplex TaxID=6269 RepID=A0A0M3JR81_ANISI|nr:unnamed protein product [Anisakis simplex]
MCIQVESGKLNDLHLNHILLAGAIPWTEQKFHGITSQLHFDTIFTALTFKCLPKSSICLPTSKCATSGKIRSNCMFLDSGIRKLVQQGLADYTPMFLSDTSTLYSTFAMPVDVALITVSPIDEHGYCTLGVSADCSVSAVRAARNIIALVNETMPRTFGDTTIHCSHIDALVNATTAIHAKSDLRNTESDDEIGKLIAENLVDNGATLQLGIGAIPDSVLSAMRNHKDLGIHTEMFSDGVIDLIQRNVINNSKKNVDPGKVIATFAYGTEQFYKFINNNPLFAFRSCAYTNDPQLIRRHHKMTAINSAIEIDLTGQIASDSIGASFYSGFGGQTDFVYGTATAEDGQGKAIIALPSTTAKGQSKIVPFLKEGAGVVATRGHARYIVTEYGIANIWGKSVRQRAYELIRIAHPDHRKSLEKAAFERLKCMPSRG